MMVGILWIFGMKDKKDNMQIYFHSRLCSYLPRVPILVEGTVYIYIYIYIYICIVYIYIYTLLFKSLESVRFLNVFIRVSYAHQGYIYLMIKHSKTVILWNYLKNHLLFFNIFKIYFIPVMAKLNYQPFSRQLLLSMLKTFCYFT